MHKISKAAAAVSMAITLAFGAVSGANAASSYEFSKPIFVHVDGKKVDSAQFGKSKDFGYMFEASVELSKGEHTLVLADAGKTCGTTFVADTPDGKVLFGKTTKATACGGNKTFKIKIMLPGVYNFSLNMFNPDVPTIKVLRATTGPVAVKRVPPKVKCLTYKGGPVTVKVEGTWPNGTLLRDAYTGKTAQVKGGKVTFTPGEGSQGLIMIEEAAASSKPAPFSWDNAVIYFMITDRFNNGDKSNDNSFGRQKDGKDEIGTFHGGDFKGIIQKLDYLKDLGINAIWITPMVEQQHGYIGGGDETHTWPFYAYHGYWAADFTKLDPNLGTEDDLRALVRECHKRGIRLVVDTVLNHAGYATLADIQDFDLDVLRTTNGLPKRYADYKPQGYANWQGYSQFIDYNSKGWLDWWGNKWVRAGLPHHQSPGTDDQNMSVAGLPDFLTESNQTVGLPKFLKEKDDTKAKELPNATVLDYLTTWQSDWVKNFGIDGLRCDTVKHVQAGAWKKLREKAEAGLKEWKAKHPSEKIDDQKLYMVGEVWDHGLSKNPLYYNNGFDSLINFDYQRRSLDYAQCMADADSTYVNYAKLINNDPTFNALSYISSHDTKLFWGDFEDFDLQKRAANAFLMLPGQVQIYYGDESGRRIMPDGGYPDQATRSDMNWADLNKPEYKSLVQHWSKLNHFRLAHPAIAEGTHKRLGNAKTPYYAFVRQKGNDKVMVVFAGNNP